ncbi:hypothetical protein [Paraburkholderia tagetis]|uniref:Uncharacterized protein n=1 Tax=Paraburkholderia tagetis TaxID=2913261 RepID=A0A9X2A1Q0_9BURK|nr:hypothetical protein [Paraburkholderia tagetis]MCG5078800.1 hypothetical protein [Paraburkholderia tagetis]
MGICKYCGKPAGLFHNVHPQCEQQHIAQEIQQFQQEEQPDNDRRRIIDDAIDCLMSSGDLTELDAKIADDVKTLGISASEQKSLLVEAWAKAVSRNLEQKIIDVDTTIRLTEYAKHFNLSNDDLNIRGAYVKFMKSELLRRILEGTVPTSARPDNLPVNLQKGEGFVWGFTESPYYEERTRREFVGRSSGISVRMMKGVYCRTGHFEGHSIEHLETVKVDIGSLVITDKNIYFAGKQKAMRIPYSKIISFEAYSDGFGVMRDSASAKPQSFQNGDGWFSYNLVTNLAKL